VAALIWFARAIVILLILRIVLRLLFGTRAPMRQSRPGASGPAERVGGELVRDPQCGTYVPKSRAVVVGAGDAAQYFCSTTCRDAFEARVRTSNFEVRT
jgi:YHS domain-containing protein